MRVLVCIASMAEGGAERQVTYLAKGLVELGHDIHVVLITQGANYKRLQDSRAAIHIVNIYPRAFRFILPLFRLFRLVKPDVIYLWQRPFDVLGGLAALLAGIPVVHAERTDPRKIEYGLKVWFRNVIVAHSSAVITNSTQGLTYWQGRTKFVHISKIPNIVPYEEMQRVQSSAESAVSIVSICRLDVNKNVITLLRAVKLLSQRGIECKVIVVGDGGEADNLKRFVIEQDISSNVRFLGHRNDVWRLLKGCKGFISLSFYEGEPNAALEAAALGCRMILSDIPAHRSLESLCSVTFVNPDAELEVANALALLGSDVSGATNANVFNSLNPEWTKRSIEAVARQHLEVFSHAVVR